MIPVLSVVGKSNSGKTTLIEKIIFELRNRNIKVGILKHTSHKININDLGKDSWRYRNTGSKTVMLVSKACVFFSKNRLGSLEKDIHYFKDRDILIIEGNKKGRWPKIEVFCSKLQKNFGYVGNFNILAVVSDVKLNIAIPQFKNNEIIAISDFIEYKILKKSL